MCKFNVPQRLKYIYICASVCCSWRQTLSSRQSLHFDTKSSPLFTVIRSRHRRILCNSDIISPTHSSLIEFVGCKTRDRFLCLLLTSQIERKRLHQCHSLHFYLLHIAQKISVNIYLISCKMKCVMKNANNLKPKWKSIGCWYFFFISRHLKCFTVFLRHFINAS